MDIFCTVGTTDFPGLTLKMIDLFDFPKSDVVLQTAVPYATRHIKAFDFSPNFESYIYNASLIVTHAGAGTVYDVLERGKKIVVVPNLQRDDKHQIELAEYVESEGYAVVCWDIKLLGNCIQRARAANDVKYRKEAFFKFEEICAILLGKR